MWVELVTILAILQFFCFGILVGRARKKYGVQPPAMVGNPIVERLIRVQQNTLEVLMMFIPSLWIASRHWGDIWPAVLGAIYLFGRMVYLQGYRADPKKRHVGYGISIVPVLLLMLVSLIAIIRGLILV